jgi:hypothetical protein
VICFLHHVTGPEVGLPALRGLFPEMPRCILEDLLRRYRRVWRRRYRRKGFRLTWHVPGAAWAMDFSKTQFPIDAEQACVFTVRDLASRQQLAWEPVSSETTAAAGLILERLFRAHGSPLVIKSDNGSAFISQLMSQLLGKHRVIPLFSPPQYPQYNGAIERSNRTNKMVTHLHAIGQGHPHRWTSEDLEHARTLANTLTRPWGHQGATPEEAWQGRSRIEPAARDRFKRVLAQQHDRAKVDLGMDQKASLTPGEQRQVDRMAIERTLEELEYLSIKRERGRRKKSRRGNELVESKDHAREDGCSTPQAGDPLSPPRRVEADPAREMPPRVSLACPSPPTIASPSVTTLCLPAPGDAENRTREKTNKADKKTLAPSSTRVTIPTASIPSSNASRDASSSETTRREWPLPRWLRKVIAPLLFVLIAAIFL